LLGDVAREARWFYSKIIQTFLGSCCMLCSMKTHTKTWKATCASTGQLCRVPVSPARHGVTHAAQRKGSPAAMLGFALEEAGWTDPQK